METLTARGDQILILSRRKDVACDLLDTFGLDQADWTVVIFPEGDRFVNEGQPQPVLVDFDNSIPDRQGLLSSQGESLIAARRLTRPWWKRLVPGENRTSPASACQLVTILKSEQDSSVVLIVGGGTISDGTQILYWWRRPG